MRNTSHKLKSKEIAMIKNYLSKKPFIVKACKYLTTHKYALWLFMALFGLIFGVMMVYVPQLLVLLTLLCYAE